MFLFPFSGHVFISQGIGTLQESPLARCAGGRSGASVQQRNRSGGHSAAQIERPARSLLHRHLRSGRRDEPQKAAGMLRPDNVLENGHHQYRSRLSQVIRGFAEKQHIFAASKFTSRVEVDAPSTKIYRFHGAVIHPSGERVPVSTESLLLRESRLKVCSKLRRIKTYWLVDCIRLMASHCRTRTTPRESWFTRVMKRRRCSTIAVQGTSGHKSSSR